MVCQRGGFPSGGNPVLDLSVYEGTRHDLREFSLFRVEGFAADGVSAVQFFRPNGDVALTVPVSGNVYSAGKRPEGPDRGLRGRRRQGRQAGVAVALGGVRPPRPL